MAVIKICVKILQSGSFMGRSTNGVMRKVNQIWWKWQKEVNTVPWQIFVFLHFVQSYCTECKWMKIIWKTKGNCQLPEHVQRETKNLSFLWKTEATQHTKRLPRLCSVLVLYYYCGWTAAAAAATVATAPCWTIINNTITTVIVK